MAEGATLTFDYDAFERVGRAIVTAELKAAKAAVASSTRDLELALEAATRSGVPGRLWRAWKSRTYPKGGGLAYAPAGEVFVPGKAGGRTVGAMTFWTQPGEIRSKNGFYLAIPLPAAGPRGRRRDLSPGEWERQHGIRLRFVYRSGRASLLVADGAKLSGRGVADRNRNRTGRGSTTVPIFVLIAFTRFRNSVAVEPLVTRAGRQMVDRFIRAPR